MDPGDKTKKSCQLDDQPASEATDTMSSIPGPVRKIRDLAPPVLSPITEVSLILGEATLATPTSSKPKVSRIGLTGEKTEANENIDAPATVAETDGLISNTFTINSAGISPATRQSEQRARGLQRRMNSAPQHVNFDIKFDSPEKDGGNINEDISFYSTNNVATSPRPCPISPCRDETSLLSPGSSPSMFIIENNVQLPRLNSLDSSSMDSGYSGHQTDNSNSRLSQSSVSSASSAFQFVEPRRPEVTSSPSALTTPSKYSSASVRASSLGSGKGFTVFSHSLSSGSGESMDDDYMELMDMESLDEESQLPTDLSSLICKDIKSSSKTPEGKATGVRKCLNMNNVKNSLFSSPPTPKNSTIATLITTPERRSLQKISENVTPFRNVASGTFKRPEPPVDSPIQSKRYKCENDPPVSAEIMKFPYPQFNQKRPILRKSMSMNDAVIMNALSRSSSDSNLIGDFSQNFCLPLIEGRHSDLKSISAETMRKLMLGEFDESVASYKVIDCRYPYEFEGGHICGALNLYTHEQILEELVTKLEAPVDGTKRNILVFHCEFSSERGPKLSRFLRNHDRSLNTYPALHYPEIYLLHGGYKEFFESNSDLCDPIAYRPMLEPQFTDEYKHFRAKTKSWTGDVRASASNRLTKSRSRLVL